MKHESTHLNWLGNKGFLAVLGVMWALFTFYFANFAYDILSRLIAVFEHLVNYQEFNNDLLFNINLVESFTVFKGQGISLIFYLIFYAIMFFGFAKFSYRMVKSFGTLKKEQYGGNRFVTVKELKKQYKIVPESKVEFKGKGGIIISHLNYKVNGLHKYLKRKKINAFGLELYKYVPYIREKVFIDTDPVNSLIVGMSRSGKGETTVFPSIDINSRSKEKPSLVHNDPKGELAAASKDTLENRGYDVHILNLVDQEASMSYNPLQLIIDSYKKGDYEGANVLVNTISYSLYDDPTAKDKFWQNAAKSLCNALILAITADSLKKGQEEKITLYTVANMLAEYGGNEYQDASGVTVNELDEFFKKRPANDPARQQYATSNFAKGNMRAGVMGVAMEKLTIFTNPKIAKLTSKNSMNLKDIGFGEKPLAVFMVTPDYDLSLHVIASIYVRQLYFVLAKEASMQPNNKCHRQVVFNLDEFGNMPPIEGLANILTVCLGRNIIFNLYIQAYQQINNLYGDDVDTITGNCGNIIYIKSSDDKTLEKISTAVGSKTIIDVSRSGKPVSLDKTENETTKERNLLTPSELRQLKQGETVVIRAMKNKDKRDRDIVPFPIFNTKKTRLSPRWMYLEQEFDTKKSINDIEVDTIHNDVSLPLLHFDASSDSDKFNLAKNELGSRTINVWKEKILQIARIKDQPLDYLNFIENGFDHLTVYQFTTFLYDAATKGILNQQDYELIYHSELESYFNEEERENFHLNIHAKQMINEVLADNDKAEKEKRIREQQERLKNNAS